MSDAPTASKGMTATVIAVIGVFAIFLLILRMARTPATPVDAAANVPAEEQWKLTSEGRKNRLTEVRARDQAVGTGYSWLDQDAGVVLLPLDRAMELTIEEINARKK